MVLRQRVTLRILAAARTRSLLLMILAAAAAISGMIAHWSCFSWASRGGIVEEVFAEFADRHALRAARKASLVEGIEDQAPDVVLVGIDQRLADDFRERQVGELAFGGDAFAFRPRGDSGQLVAGLLFVGFGEKLAEVGECEALGHRWDATEREIGVLGESSTNYG